MIKVYYEQGQRDGAAGYIASPPHGTGFQLLSLASSSATRRMAEENEAYMKGYRHGAKNKRR